VAAGKEPKFITNDVTRDPLVHNHEWAAELGLVSFAGYRLVSAEMEPLGVLALFSKHPITPGKDSLLEGLANSTAQVVLTARAEEALRAAIVTSEDEKSKTESIIAGIGDGISIQGTDTKVLYQNQIHKEMFGCQEGNSCVGTYEPDVSGGCCAVVLCFRDGKIHKAERKVATDGETRHYEITAAPLRDASGKITSGVEVVRDVTERKRAEEELRKRTHDIGELVKELNCLYGASRLMAEPDLTPEEVFDGIVGLIPESMQYPAVTCAGLSYERRRFKTKNFKETKWRLSADITVSGKKTGAVDVFYLEEMPEDHEGPFQNEERALIDTLARELGEYIERKLVDEKLSHRTHDLGERVKDLNCLYGASRLMAEPDMSEKEILERTVRLIPPSWQYPDITCARITLDGTEYKTKNFKETKWRLSSDITVSGERAGGVDVYYLKKIPPDHEGPFQTEERELIDALGREVGRFIERKKAEGELKRLASTDKLTGAFNRTKFDEIIEREVERAKRFDHPLSLIMFDIDHFKEINDTYGHLTGDAVLRDLTALVKKVIRKIDYLVRWGGEEFVIIAPETRLEKALGLAERVRKAVEKNRFGDIKGVTASFGLTTFGKDDDIDRVLTRVDNAMYKAKSGGRNQVEIGA
jgi:diguanylate cyclase (GGDEF)-like protein